MKSRTVPAQKRLPADPISSILQRLQDCFWGIPLDKRQALIERAVSKGLDAKASPMLTIEVLRILAEMDKINLKSAEIVMTALTSREEHHEPKQVQDVSTAALARGVAKLLEDQPFEPPPALPSKFDSVEVA